MIQLASKGSFKNTIQWLLNGKKGINPSILYKYGERGVAALAEATPKRTGLTASSWKYDVKVTETSTTITFSNTNIQNGLQIAILLQYGHATKNGGFVQGIDYINPALQPIFDEIADEAWKEVTGK